MHIPDGYLGPITCGAAYAAMAPIWAIASHRVKKTLSARQVPLLAIGAAFSFVIMMFNIPIPGGTTGHAVGAVLVAILLGPWAACIAVSVALVIQALLFGDGGITAIGADCFNMAFVMPFAGYAIYRLISGNSPARSFVRVAAAAVAGYLGLVIASLCAGIEFGIQPHLHHTASGQALYCPYGLLVAVPGMLGGHLLVFGWIEAIVTGLAVKYLAAQDASWLRPDTMEGKKSFVKIVSGLIILALLTPVGLYIPYKLRAGTAWGEWSAEELKGFLGYVPAKLERLLSFWHAPLPDYAFAGWRSGGQPLHALVYVLSALIGIGLCVALVLLVGKVISKKEKAHSRKRPWAGGFLERTILGTVSLLKDTVSMEGVAAKNGFLQRRDPRFKCLSAVALLITVLMSKSIAELSILYCIVLLLVGISSIGLLFFLERTLLFVPIFSFFIVIPAIFNIVTPGEPIVSFNLFALTLSITRQGVDSAIIFFMRVFDSVSVAVLLVLTTRQHVLLKTLRLFRVPQLFVMTMGMSFRYIFLFLDIIQKMFVAIKSRVGFVSSTKEGRRVVSSNMAALWLRSYRMQSQVYDAMVSRGYAGEAQVLDEFGARPLDYIILFLALCALAGTVWLNRFFH
jgi:cobalt/nickel transport system permease protein